ncbi:exodeoxyribonuclease VII small subunit [Vallitalea okinawensis]|uniref:exodeoxyribonuclease VII small subunit n=1 Tax=Vallitalea okinawensis TaxID=2078660 RepID=UPI000CFCE848|nr:exodeoxyribonuclease VII small subunit [Vallitalea okinawensis]
MEKKYTFEEAMKRLEEIVEKLESGKLPLEDSIKYYKEGLELSTQCNLKLEEAEKQLIVL